MIIIELIGGLGSQMSVYATGLAIAKKTKQKLKVDTSHLTSWRLRKPWSRDPEILKMDISGREATKEEVKKFLFKTSVSYIDSFFKKKRWFEKNVYHENEDFNVKNFSSIGEGYLRGAFSNLECLIGLKDILRKEFTLKKKSNKMLKWIKDIKSSESVSIHVRRGDLLKLREGYVLPMDYYKKAVEEIKKKVKNPKFYIFSDGMDWCKKNFHWIDNKVFIENNLVVEDFELMKNCKHHILANSSLSWWVDYFKKKYSLVIAPKHFSVWKSDNVDKDSYR